MTVFIMFLAVLAAFATGFLSGLNAVPTQKPKKVTARKEEEELLRLRREYANFLSYDGTEQEEDNARP